MKVEKHRIGELCRMVRGTSPTLKTEPGPYPLVVTASYRRTADSWQLEGPAVCIPLVSSTGHGHAALHRVHYQEGKFALANLLVALLPKDPSVCDAHYLYHLLMTQKDELLVPLMQGTANVSLKEQDIAGVEIPLPSLAGQRRVVARIKELGAQIDEARTLRHQAAGEAEALLPRAAEELLSNGFPLSQLEEVCSVITDGTHQTPRYTEDGAIFLSAKNIKPFRFMPEEHRKVSLEDFRGYTSRNKPQRGDVLLTRVGAGIGEAAVVDQDIEFAIYVSLALIRTDRSRLSPEFLVHWLNSPVGRASSYRETLGRGTSQGNLNLKLLRGVVLPVPPLPEQRRIAFELDTLLAEVDTLKRLQAETDAELDALLSAIFDRAFRGEL